MKMKTTLIAATALAIGLGTVAFAAGFERQIKARQALMQVYAFNLGNLGAMAKGQVEYNADSAKAAADNLLAAASMNGSAMWPQGSDMGANAGMTWAKAEIWTTFPKIGEKSKALVDAATKMAAEAGNGLDAVKANIGAVGGSCKGCHDDFRAPKS